MEDLFIRILNISIAASFLVLAIILYRLIAKKTPKWVSILLWGLVGLRLLFPFSIESALSLIPSENTVPTTITHDRYPALDTGFESVDEIVNPILSGSMEARPEYSANPIQVWLGVLGWIWLTIMLCMLLYMAASFIYLRIKTRVKIHIEDKIYLCDQVKTPFILGIIRPRIYLPSDVSDKAYPLVVAHERAHIKRLDHIWKPLGFLLLSVYWFNPLLWIAYVLLCRDIESACDEKVISDFGDNEKADYSEALLTFGIKSRVISACPLAFGEVSVKSRVSAISSYSKPKKAVIALSLAVCLIFSLCFLTYKKSEVYAIDNGYWTIRKVISSIGESESSVAFSRFIFTEGGDVLAESAKHDGSEKVRLGKMNSAYISEGEYDALFASQDGYEAELLREAAKNARIITPPVSSGIPYEKIYLLYCDGLLYMGFSKEEKISLLYLLEYDSEANAVRYSTRYGLPDYRDFSVLLYTNGMGRILFGGEMNYEAMCTYKYENSRLILKTADSFEFKLVFLDVGDKLIYSEKDSDTGNVVGLIPDGASFHAD